MCWQGTPEILMGRIMEDGPRNGCWTVPTISERDDDGEREAVSLGLLKATGLPLNPTRFVEIRSEVKDQSRSVDYAVCITMDESLAG